MNDWFNFQDKAGGAAELSIFGEIGAGTSSQLVSKLNAIPVGRKILLAVDSPGGSVIDGLAIYTAIEARSKDVTARVGSLAASMGSVITCAAGRVVMGSGSLMLLHKPSNMSGGNDEELRRKADQLTELENRLVAIYMQKSGQSDAAIRKALRDEKMFNAQEAKAFGLCDEISDSPKGFEGFSLRCACDGLLDTLRAQLDKETDPLKRGSIARQLRVLRGDGEMFQSPSGVSQTETASEADLRAKLETETDPAERGRIARQLREARGHGDLFAQREITGQQKRALAHAAARRR